MDYFINQIIHFDSINGMLKLIDNDRSTIQLSRPGSRLLTELITHSCKTMTREDLLKSVWEDHGLRPSGSNLSNHISLLRKKFSQLGINYDIIITVPKIGFSLEAEVTQVQLDHPSADRSVSDTGKGNEVLTSLLSRQYPDFPYRQNLRLFLLITLTALLIYFALTAYTSYTRKTAIVTFASCRLIDMSEDKKRNSDKKLKSLKRLIKEKKIDCQKNHSTIYFRFTNTFPTEDYDQHVIFLTQCIQNSKNRLIHCDSYLSTTIKKP